MKRYEQERRRRREQMPGYGDEDGDKGYQGRNRVMCPDCGKSKLQFETEKKAQDFIRWNGSELKRQDGNLRPYYCPACCCWHISHKQKYDGIDQRTDRMIERYNNSRKASQRIDKIQRELYLKEHAEELAREQQRLHEQAQKIFAELPPEIQAWQYKSAVKRHVTQYFKIHSIAEDAFLRTEIYNVWKEFNNINEQSV